MLGAAASTITSAADLFRRACFSRRERRDWLRVPCPRDSERMPN